MCKSGICDTQPVICLKRSSQSYYRVSIESRVQPIDWWQIWRARVFGLLFSGSKFSHKGYLAHFLSERDEIWQCWGSGQSTRISRISWTFVRGSLETMRRHASVLHWYTLKWFLDNFPMFADNFSVLSINCVARGLCQAFCTGAAIARWFPARAQPSCSSLNRSYRQILTVGRSIFELHSFIGTAYKV